jgi:DNA-binding response OmpR family regulator
LRILIIESQRGLSESLPRLLSAENFAVETAASDAGIAKALSGDFDLIILDEAADLCRELRRRGIDTSILMLTGNPVAGLKLGADDCVARSCDSNEFVARVEALLRRVPRARRSAIGLLQFGDVAVNFASAEVRKGGSLINLSSKELALLQYLAEHRERVVTRKEILQNVWEYDPGVSSRTIDVHVGWLRQKLEDHPQQPQYIKTIRGRGYRFDSELRPLKSQIVSSVLTLVNLRKRSVNS